MLASALEDTGPNTLPLHNSDKNTQTVELMRSQRQQHRSVQLHRPMRLVSEQRRRNNTGQCGVSIQAPTDSANPQRAITEALKASSHSFAQHIAHNLLLGPETCMLTSEAARTAVRGCYEMPAIAIAKQQRTTCCLNHRLLANVRGSSDSSQRLPPGDYATPSSYSEGCSSSVIS